MKRGLVEDLSWSPSRYPYLLSHETFIGVGKRRSGARVDHYRKRVILDRS